MEPSSLGESRVGEVNKEENADLLLPGTLGELGKNLAMNGAVCPGSPKAAAFTCLPWKYVF